MKKLGTYLLLTAAALGGAWLVWGQGGQRVSPREKVTAVLGGKTITIEYGRPYKKGREIFGGLVPYGKIWRTGADEATKLTTEGDLMVGSLHVPKGSYSLFTIPEPDGWTLVLNKEADQWGAYKYQESKDLGRVKMAVKKADAPVEQLTITISSQGGGKGTLSIAWDTTVASIGLMAH